MHGSLILYHLTAGDDTDTHVSEMESSIDTPRNLRFVNRHRRSNVVVESSDISSEDSHHPTGHGYTDGELTDIARAGNAETPPCRHRGDCNNMSLICQYCGKAYCTIYQSQFFTRHEKKCQQAINSGSDSEPGTKSSRYRLGRGIYNCFYCRIMFDLNGVS